MNSDRTVKGPRETKEQSLATCRDALAALEELPAAGLDGTKHDRFSDVVDELRALESQLTNEVDQLRDGEDGGSR